MAMTRWMGAMALVVAAMAAQATPRSDAQTTLSFSGLLGLSTGLHLTNTVGGDASVTPLGGRYLVNVLGELGVSNSLLGDWRINRHEAVLFSFARPVSLSWWDLDDLPRGSNQFLLAVDGAAPQTLSLHQHQLPSRQPLVGQTFAFGWSGDAYLIDSLTFTRAPAVGTVVTAVPEPGTYALMAACLGVISLSRWCRTRG